MPPTTASPRRFPAIEGDEAQNLGRQVTRLSPARMIFRQAQGAAPDPGQHPSAPPRQLSPVQLLTWATCLAAAWPRAEDDPYPGLPFRRENVLRACIKIGAHDRSVVAALRMLPQTGLIRFTGPIGRLGPAAAALPNDTWSALRRMHDRLPHAALQQQNTASADITAPDDADATTGARRLPGPLAGPVGISDTLVRAAVTALENARTSRPLRPGHARGSRDPARHRERPRRLRPPVLPPALLARTRELDARHRATTGRPISRDNLRAQLRIGRDRASALVAVVRAEAAGEPRTLPQAA